jgi:hypothetical protein
MFICADCEKVSKPREGANKVVVEKRPARYTDKTTGRFISEGWEIVKEKMVCDKCLGEDSGT